MMRRISAKLRHRAGETIAETLLALLVSSLALLMLAGAISSATRVITTAKTTMANYYTGDSAIVTRASSAMKQTISMTLQDKTEDDALADITYQVDCYENATFAGKPVVAYVKHNES